MHVAMVAIPQVIMVKSSLLVMEFKYGLINRGDSTIPTKIFADTPIPSTPPVFNIFCSQYKNSQTYNTLNNHIFSPLYRFMKTTI
jgi:hypothetical protein